MDMSQATLVGRLTRDAELKYSQSGSAICKFSVAVNVRSKGRDGNWVDDGNFYEVVLFGKTAESLAQYLLKGKMVAVSGSMKQDRWEQEGVQRMAIEINASQVALLGGGDDDRGGRNDRGPYRGDPAERPYSGGDNRQPPQRQAPPPQRPPQRQAPPQRRPQADDDFPDDIPF